MAKKILLLDFDGTVVPSNQIKDGAYFELFPDISPGAKDKIGKMSKGSRKTRYQIIRELLVFLKEEGEVEYTDLEAEVDKLAIKYGEVVEEGILNSEGIPGNFEELWSYHKKDYAFYLISGTPQEPLSKVVNQLVADGKIPPPQGIYGRLGDADELQFKKEAIDDILEKEETEAAEVTFVGDGDNDYKAAKDKGCEFVGVTNESNNWKEDEVDFKVIERLKELEPI